MESNSLVHKDVYLVCDNYNEGGALSLLRRPPESWSSDEAQLVKGVWLKFLDHYPRYIEMAESIHARRVLTGQWGIRLLQEQVKVPRVTLFHINLARLALLEVMEPAIDLLESAATRQAKQRHLQLIKVVLVGKENTDSSSLPASMEEAFDLELFEKVRFKHMEQASSYVQPLLNRPFSTLVTADEKEAVTIYATAYMREVGKAIAESGEIRNLFLKRVRSRDCFRHFETPSYYGRKSPVRVASLLAHIHFSRLSSLALSPDLEVCFSRFIQVIGVGIAGAETLPFPKDNEMFQLKTRLD